MEIMVTWTPNTVIPHICIKASFQVESIPPFMDMFKDAVARIF